MQAFIATIRTATAAATELLIAETEAAALADAERRHSTDSQTVLITVEAADFETVIVVSSATQVANTTKLLQPVVSIRRPADATPTTPATPTRVLAPFAVFGETEPVMREVELLKSFPDGYSRVRLDATRTATVHTSTIRPLVASTATTQNSTTRQQLAAA